MLRMGGVETSVSPQMREAILRADELFVTPIARAEIAIKLSIGKLRLPASEVAFWNGLVDELQATEIPFLSVHAGLLAELPFHHRDPFDRMIIAQCLSEGLHAATTDSIFAKYGVQTVS